MNSMTSTAVSNLLPPNITPRERERLKAKIAIERERRRRQNARRDSAPVGWREWLTTLFPGTFSAPFAPRHGEFWNHIETIQRGRKSPAFFAVWPRGGGKTTNTEAAAVRLGAKEERKFCLYVRSTQDKANESVQNIAAMLEGRPVAYYYPLLASRKLGKYGNSKGWKIDTLRCGNSFSVIGLGLDAAVRGIKIEEFRPDLIVLDDIDDATDTTETIKKKIDTITKSILPAGSTDVAIIGSQNLIHANSIFSKIADNTAEFLLDRIVSGPYPAVDNLVYEQKPDGKGYRITGGAATWAGQPLSVCETQINEWGLSAFLKESQHQVEESGGIWDHIEFGHCTFAEVPDLVDGEVWVDPAVTATDNSDCHAIAAGGIDESGTIYVMYAWEQVVTPLESLKRAILKAVELGFSYVGIETDQGGDTWHSVYTMAWNDIVSNPEISYIVGREAAKGLGVRVSDWPDYEAFICRSRELDNPDEWEPVSRPQRRSAKAGAGHGSKVERNQRMLSDYERGQVVHVVGTHTTLEKSLRRFPLKPLDLADANYWLWYHLQKKRRRSSIR